MQRIGLIVLCVAVVFASVANAAPAEARQLISMGIVSQGGETLTYGYGELDLSPTLALGVGYRSDEVFAISLWHGMFQGMYGKYTGTTSGDSRLVQLGAWRSISLIPAIDLTGWIGGENELAGSGLWVRAGAELQLDVADSVALVGGAEMTLLKKVDETLTWFGVGYYF